MSWDGNFHPTRSRKLSSGLIERRYIVPASYSSTGVVAGYWASLGLPPGVAEQNLGNCRVRVQSIDVQGAAEFGTALSDLGVRVVNRSPDLTVTLVNDYLERRLAELNRQRVSDQTPWLLVQPSGAFPLVGPVFRPGRRRLLDLPVRPHDPEQGGQGISRPRSRRARSRFHRLPAIRSDKAPSSSQPSKSPRRSRPAFAPS